MFGNQWSVVKHLANGGFSVAWLIQDSRGKFAVAKVTEYSKEDEFKVKECLDAEIMALKSVQGHANFVQLYDVLEQPGRTVLILEYVDGIELFDFLEDAGKLETHVVKDIARQLYHAVSYMHSQGILWRDLKLDNIMIDRQGLVKCLDFNLATSWKNGQMLQHACGTPQYASPFVLFAAVFRSEYLAHECLDWWGLGITLYCLATGHFPFRSTKTNDLLYEIREVAHGKKEIDYDGIDEELVGLLRILLSPGTRVSDEEVGCHSWFRKKRLVVKNLKRSASVDSLATLVNPSSEM